ncbi:MAG: hypothetical protein ABII00_05905 [Elusimicrobiota bacterium]
MLGLARGGRWWALSALSVYLYLAGFTWVIHQGGAHAAERLEPRRFGPFEPMGSGDARQRTPPYRRILQGPDGYSLEFGFKNFNGDVLSVKASLDSGTVSDSVREFGYSQDELDDLDAWYKRSQESAIAAAKGRYVSGKVTAKTRAELARKMERLKAQNARIEQELDRTIADLAREYRRRRLEVFDRSGFRLKGKGILEVDIPAMVRRNWKRVRPVALSFADLSRRRGYDAEDLVGAASAMVQTAMRYEVPGRSEGSRVIAGMLPPPKALALGQGDCDTKTAVLASILMSWPNLRMVGLSIPGHYLMAVQRVPRSGDVFIEHEGFPFVMIESAGPAWLPPGRVGDTTRAYLEAGNSFGIQPLDL